MWQEKVIILMRTLCDMSGKLTHLQSSGNLNKHLL